MSGIGEKLQPAVRLLRKVFTPVALVFLAVAAYASRDVFVRVVADALPLLLAATVIGWSLTHLVAPLSTWAILRGFGAGIGFRTILGIHVSRLPTRYLPGGVWHTVSRAVDLNARGVGKAELTAMVVLENALPLAVALAAGGTCLLLAGDTRLPAPAIVAVGLAGVLVLPWILRLVARTASPLPLRHYLATTAAICAFWTLAGTTFALFLSAFPQTDLDGKLAAVLAAYWLSWSAGFLAIFAPQGIGIFESVAGLLLQSSLPFASMALLVAGFRACMLSGDALAFGAGWLIRRAAIREIR